MSNLGGYQIFTTIAKKVGGPGKLTGLIFGAGFIAGSICSIKGVEKLKEKIKSNEYSIDDFYTVKQNAIDESNLELREGDTFKVLALDHDATLIEITNNDNNPYFVSGSWLEEISNYKKLVEKNNE